MSSARGLGPPRLTATPSRSASIGPRRRTAIAFVPAGRAPSIVAPRLVSHGSSHPPGRKAIPRFEPSLRGRAHAGGMRTPRSEEDVMAALVVAVSPASGMGRADARIGIFPGGATPSVFPAGTPFWIGYGFAPEREERGRRARRARPGHALRARRGRTARLDAQRPPAARRGHRAQDGRRRVPRRAAGRAGTTSPAAGTTAAGSSSPAGRRSSSSNARLRPSSSAAPEPGLGAGSAACRARIRKEARR